MPYRSNRELPPAVQRVLPAHAQDIYREAFNSAWRNYRPGGADDDARCHRIAWAAVKKRYRKIGDEWVESP